MSKNKKILIINTGGTISMVPSNLKDKKSPLKPSKSWYEVTSNYQFLNSLNVDYVSLSQIIDSSDMNYKLWFEMAEIIDKNYDKYKGFVILHGTDTMAYTASALSFMLKNLDKTVILTGAQKPIQEMRSDGLQNLLTAIEIIEKQTENGILLEDELPVVPEVCIFFRDHLIRGNRARKLDATNYFGFSSPNYLPLGEAGSKIKINKNRLIQGKEEMFYVDYKMNPNVLMLDLFPSFNPIILKNIFLENNEIKGLVLRSYGSGNTPQSKEFLEVIKCIIDNGVVVLNITQCTVGSVETVYESNEVLTNLGVVNGYDMTPESAITKMMYLLGKYEDTKLVKIGLIKNLAGELTK